MDNTQKSMFLKFSQTNVKCNCTNFSFNTVEHEELITAPVRNVELCVHVTQMLALPFYDVDNNIAGNFNASAPPI